jgi:HEPN domain-containing protein
VVSLKPDEEKDKNVVRISHDDLSLAKELLAKTNKVYYAAHFCHQAIEKLIKAIISEKTEEIPLPTHNFKILLEQAKLKDIPEEKKGFIFSLTPHYIGTKYLEDITKLYTYYSRALVSKLYKETYKLFQWLKNYLK